MPLRKSRVVLKSFKNAGDANPLTFVSPMWSIASSTSNSVWLREPRLLNFLENFMRERAQFMDSSRSWNPHVAQRWFSTVNMSEYEKPAVVG